MNVLTLDIAAPLSPSLYFYSLAHNSRSGAANLKLTLCALHEKLQHVRAMINLIATCARAGVACVLHGATLALALTLKLK